MRYFQDTLDQGVMFLKLKGKRNKLTGFNDLDLYRYKVERINTMVYVWKLSKSPISWCSKKKIVVALSSREVECISTCNATYQGGAIILIK